MFLNQVPGCTYTHVCIYTSCCIGSAAPKAGIGFNIVAAAYGPVSCSSGRPHCPCHCWRFLQTVNTGSLRWGTINLLAFFYMVFSWGGYSFVINLIPIYCLACIVTGRFTSRHYLAFAPLVLTGTILAGGMLHCWLAFEFLQLPAAVVCQ